jgi:hypothetical protein
MSRAGLRVVFPDGEVRCGMYQGTIDVCDPWLYATDKEAWDDNRPSSRSLGEDPEGDVFDVVIYSDYGGGFWWRGKAAKNVITEGRDWWYLETHDGVPDEVKAFYEKAAADYARGVES